MQEWDDIHFSVALSYNQLDTLRKEQLPAKGSDKLKSIEATPSNLSNHIFPPLAIPEPDPYVGMKQPPDQKMTIQADGGRGRQHSHYSLWEQPGSKEGT